MIIDCIGCLHNEQPALPGGDLLIITGDLTGSDKLSQYETFNNWCANQAYDEIVVIAGNHDNLMQKDPLLFEGEKVNFTYLNNDEMEFRGLKIWGVPYSLWFQGINRHCQAFTGNEYVLEKAYAKIPDDIDILISHGPMKYILDENKEGIHCGSMALRECVERIKPKLFVSSHIHEGYGSLLLKNEGQNTLCINCSHMNEEYKAVNKPIRVTYDKKTTQFTMETSNQTN